MWTSLQKKTSNPDFIKIGIIPRHSGERQNPDRHYAAPRCGHHYDTNTKLSYVPAKYQIHCPGLPKLSIRSGSRVGARDDGVRDLPAKSTVRGYQNCPSDLDPGSGPGMTRCAICLQINRHSEHQGLASPSFWRTPESRSALRGTPDVDITTTQKQSCHTFPQSIKSTARGYQNCLSDMDPGSGPGMTRCAICLPINCHSEHQGLACPSFWRTPESRSALRGTPDVDITTTDKQVCHTYPQGIKSAARGYHKCSSDLDPGSGPGMTRQDVILQRTPESRQAWIRSSTRPSLSYPSTNFISRLNSQLPSLGQAGV